MNRIDCFSEEVYNKLLQRTTVEANGCMIWTGAVSQNGAGYAHTRINGQLMYVHRYIGLYNLDAELRDIVQDTMIVMHTCDVKICINPAHLIVGTHTENLKDAYRKNHRQVIGTGNSRLHVEDVLAIRSLYNNEGVGLKELASKFGVTPENISLIVRYKIWQHV